MMFFSNDDDDQLKKRERHREARRNRRGRASDDESVDSAFSSDSDDKPGAVAVGGTGKRPSNNNATSTGFEQFMTYFQLTKPESKDSGDHVLMAEPVDDFTQDIDDAEKQKIEEKAKQDVKLKYFPAAVEMEVADLEAEEKDRKQKRMMRCLIIGFSILLLGGGGAALAIALSRPGPQQSEAPTMAPVLPPSLPIFNPGDSFELDNFVCDSAFDIASTIGDPFSGNITDLAQVAPVDTCGDIFRNGVGVWYRVEGDGSRYFASTCDGTTFDTQISVLSGACGKLQCVAGNDQMRSCGNGDQSLVGFATEPDVDYYVYVQSRRQATELFQILVDKLVFNDDCTAATNLEFVESDRTLTPVRVDSTRGMTIDNNVECNGIVPNAPGVWYTITGLGWESDIGEALTLRFASTSSDFFGRVMVFVGDGCGELLCISNSGFEWDSEEGVTFYILVYGFRDDSEGDFQFYIERSERPTGTVDPVDPTITQPQICWNAPLLEVGDIPTFGSTFNDGIEPFGSCGNLVFSTSASVWWDVVGTGNPMTVSTCSSTTSFDTQISVFRGPCEELQCIDGNDQACGDQSSVSWFSEAGVTYHIAVLGFGVHRGDFNITVDEQAIRGNENCDTAQELSLEGGVTILGDSAAASPQTNPGCGTALETGPGVWYKLMGTGRSITASTCLSTDAISTRITIFRGGCGSLDCVEYEETPCGSNHYSVAWEGDANVEYYVLVQARDVRGSGGRFSFYAEETVSNSLCSGAIGPLATDSSPTFGSTRSAGPGPPRGVWYTVIGTGTSITASTFSEFTNFETRLTVFISRGASCDDLVFVQSLFEDTDDTEEFGLVRSWGSIAGETYFVVVEGASSASFGNFALTLSAG